TFIQDVASNPFGTFNPPDTDDKWIDADKPFRFVAACRELAAYWGDPDNFVTHLPIAFDGSANGLQHLALLSGDSEAAEMVNLTDPSKLGEAMLAPGTVKRPSGRTELRNLAGAKLVAAERKDVYLRVAARVRTLGSVDSAKWADE